MEMLAIVMKDRRQFLHFARNNLCKRLTYGSNFGIVSSERVIAMPQTTNLSIRMDKALKSEADQMFNEMGLNLTTAITIFVRQALREKRMPFEISLDNGRREHVRLNAINALSRMQKEAKDKGLDKMSIEDINDEVDS